MIRVLIPYHLRTLAKTGADIEVEVSAPVTISRILDAVENKYPMLSGTIREHGTLKRRAFLRFFACSEDISFQSPDAELPDEIASGKEPFMIVGSVAGG